MYLSHSASPSAEVCTLYRFAVFVHTGLYSLLLNVSFVVVLHPFCSHGVRDVLHGFTAVTFEGNITRLNF